MNTAEAFFTSSHFAISATVFLLEASCIIGIDPLGIPSTFSFQGDYVLASSGFAIEFPDDETARQVRERFQASPDQVIVVECGPDGETTYHAIS